MPVTDILWFAAVAGGPIILGGALLYALTRTRRLTDSERRAQSDAIHDLYKGENRR